MSAQDTFLFTSESVTGGHPDKICDQIPDSIWGEVVRLDRNSRVAIESLATTGLVHIADEVRTKSSVEIPAMLRDLSQSIKRLVLLDLEGQAAVRHSASVRSLRTSRELAIIASVALGMAKRRRLAKEVDP